MLARQSLIESIVDETMTRVHHASSTDVHNLQHYLHESATGFNIELSDSEVSWATQRLIQYLEDK